MIQASFPPLIGPLSYRLMSPATADADNSRQSEDSSESEIARVFIGNLLGISWIEIQPHHRIRPGFSQRRFAVLLQNHEGSMNVAAYGCRSDFGRQRDNFRVVGSWEPRPGMCAQYPTTCDSSALFIRSALSH